MILARHAEALYWAGRQLERAETTTRALDVVGRNSMHRVTPTVGERTRILVVLAYNTEPGVALSEAARMTFYGRLG